MDSKPLTDLTCRVCLNVEELMVNIYEEVEDFQSNLVELLEACGGLMVDRSDNLPKYLCKVCAGELLVAAKFREKCAKSNELLGQMTLKADEADSAELVYITHASESEGSSYATMSEEILNEIIIEEVEDKQQMEIEWSEDVSIERENEDVIAEEIQDPIFSEESLFVKCVDEEGLTAECEEAVSNGDAPTNDPQSEDDLIVFDQAHSAYIVETITEKKPETKKKMQEAAPFKFDCDECGAAFSNTHNLRRHLRIVHTEFAGKIHTCSQCLHSFTRKSSWQAHCQSNHPDEPSQAEVVPKKRRTRNEVCSTCGKVCSSENSLKVHLRTHTGDRPYPCTECEKAFKTQAALSLHLKRHAGQFDWECEVCGKPFVESSNLRVHMRTHTGEKPHLCKICGRKFSRVFLLQLHLRTHTGEKPYKCDTCNKAYSQKGDLDIHKRTHTGVRPYVCPICFRGFVKSYTLQKHVRQHPKEAA